MSYRAQKFPKDHQHAGFYGIRDTETKAWVNHYGADDPDYYAETAAVAKMRAADLRYYTSESTWRSWRDAYIPGGE